MGTYPESRLNALAAALAAALFGFAFVAAPASCEWGLTAYFWGGVAVMLVLAAAPFACAGGATPMSRLGHALVYSAGIAAVWVAGLFAANVRIVCRLF